MTWVQGAPLAELQERGRALVRKGKRQLALFSSEGRVFAVDNRCPHEGYPLLQGSVNDDTCQLTCQWHNWKFALDTGECVLGEDHVRSYPTRVEDGWIYIDVTDKPASAHRDAIIAGVIEAVDDRQYSRLAREVSRLMLRELDPLDAIRAAVEHTFDRFEFGTTHAFAATADWVALYQREDDPERRVLCLTEALDHIADDALRHPHYAYPSDSIPFDGDTFLTAVENEDEPTATRLVRGESWDVLEPWLARAALAHYNDFGHAAIYVYKTGALIASVGAELTDALSLPLTRKLCYATREDLLPDFRAYAEHLAAAQTRRATSHEPLEPPVAMSVKQALGWVVEQLESRSPRSIYSALLHACALNLLRFDKRHDRAASQSVSQNVNWLFFTHAITFANAGRVLAERDPALWTAMLLQLSCFAGRIKRFVDPNADVSPWLVRDHDAFLETARALVLDHDRSEPIFSAHLIKTMTAVEQELPHVTASCREPLVGALNRFLNAPLKEKHPLRTARQALALARATI